MYDDADVELVAPEYESVLLNAFALVNPEAGARASLYGPFWEDYRRVAGIFNSMVPADELDDGLTAEQAILFMVAMKLGRLSYALQTGIAYEDPESVKDTITDAAGYLDGLWATLNNPEVDIEVDDDTEEDEDE